jgi:hypothetical protein
MARFRFSPSLILLLASVASSQQPQSDPQALSLASQSIAALTHGNAINDVTLTGSISWSSGSTPEAGTVTLLASGTGESRMSIALTNGAWTEIRDASTGMARGQWIAPSGKTGLFAFQNCATDAVWFFPALGSLAAGSAVVLTYVGQETRNGEAVQHIQSYIYQQNPPGVNPSPQRLSTMDFYLDATTLLPAAIAFDSHPDNMSSTDLPVEIDFSNYQTLNGFEVPTHIQRFLQGDVLVDINASAASFNTGLPLSDFAIN